MSAWNNPDPYTYGASSTPDDAPKRSVWDWYNENGETAVNAANSLVCLINPNNPRCRPEYQAGNGYSLPQRDMTLYVMLGFVVILLLALLIRKK